MDEPRGDITGGTQAPVDPEAGPEPDAEGGPASGTAAARPGSDGNPVAEKSGPRGGPEGAAANDDDPVVPFRVVDRRRAGGGRGDGGAPADEPASEYPTVVEDLRRRAEAAETTLRDYVAAYKKEREEMDALRKRVRADGERHARETVGRALGRFLEVVDNLDRALDHASEDDPLRDGVLKTRDLLLAALEEQGAERIEPLGEAFDPKLAEAVMTRPVGIEDHGRVVAVIRAGYTFDGKILRPAQVAVGHAPRPDEG